MPAIISQHRPPNQPPGRSAGRSNKSALPYTGKDIVGLILRTVLTVFEDFRYEHEIGAPEADRHALTFATAVDGLQLQGCDFVHTNADGLIDEFTVMLRPLKAVQAFAAKMGAAFQAAMAGQGPQSDR
ncbi:nuclear transport factor 2 family protein [Mycobacterium sp. M1]|uniref:Nuclear transport factor 2 family protein n=1 Tax=Mycolicibacter acidiphilus TaxID=2835306 RepID=A0ABS5RPQ5_9MYCO|nr:nuclear transport factor 2 family protein [Mycolicibacter acidiphilus]MBS9536278.1 nuclear transport factor 2 family protein [Mycolicibacter acidiphilus]